MRYAQWALPAVVAGLLAGNPDTATAQTVAIDNAVKADAGGGTWVYGVTGTVTGAGDNYAVNLTFRDAGNNIIASLSRQVQASGGEAAWVAVVVGVGGATTVEACLKDLPGATAGGNCVTDNLIDRTAAGNVGACCLPGGLAGSASCIGFVTAAECTALGGRYDGDGTQCAGPNASDCIPTVSEWGVAVMALLVVTAATVVMIRRRNAQPA